MTNRLIHETSPYLRQHAHNPVDWFAWGPEALAFAREKDRPIFLSIGYSACHWCHVMEKESFENPEIGRVLNDHFISIKVDREERPDLDQIYMTAVQIMTRQGGWPMSMFLTPALKPFYGGTYFPPDDRYGRPGFMRLITQLAQVWKEKRGIVEEQAGQLTEHVRSFSMANLPGGELEFMIKLYPDGKFSGLLADGNLSEGDELEVTGPFGVFTLRQSERPLLFVGGGAGMAPILSLLRSMVEKGIDRKAIYYYGARTEQDLFHLEELAELAEQLPNFTFVPALSHIDEDVEWDGARGLITEVVAEAEKELGEMDAYLCGPPPMVDAAIEMLDANGVPENRVYFDKFTTTAE